MVLYSCKLCNYDSDNYTHYRRHLDTMKHQKNLLELSKKNSLSSCKKNEKFICDICNREFKKITTLNRHKSICKFTLLSSQSLNELKDSNSKDLDNGKSIYTGMQNISKPHEVLMCEKELQLAPIGSEKSAKMQKKNAKSFAENSCKDIEPKYFKCEFCNSFYSKQSNLNRHLKKCNSYLIKSNETKQIEELKKIIEEKEREKTTLLLEKENEKLKAVIEEKEKTIEIAKNSKGNITNIQNNTNNKTINFLNQNFGELIAMEKFLYNLEHHEKLTNQERNNLLVAYKENGIDVFARNFSYIMKQNCKRQMEKEGKEDMKLLPLFCSDGSLRSHKEKGKNGWKTHYDNQSINQMLNISNDQVYELHQEIIPISGKDRNRVYNMVKRDNHVQKLKLLTFDQNNEVNVDNIVNSLDHVESIESSLDVNNDSLLDNIDSINN